MSKTFDKYPTPIAAFIALALLCLSNSLHADNYRDQLYLGFSSSSIDIGLIPVSRMDDEQLFRSAEAEMDISMSRHHRQINFNWLAMDGRQIYTGMSALRKIVRLGITKRFNRKQKHNYQQNATPEKTPKQGIFTNPDNYKLLVAEDRILLGFQYKF